MLHLQIVSHKSYMDLSDWIQSSMVGSPNYVASRFRFLLESFTFLFLETHFDLRIYHMFGIVSFWKPVLAFWELLIVLTKEIHKNISLLMFSHMQLLMMKAGEEQVGEIVLY